MSLINIIHSSVLKRLLLLLFLLLLFITIAALSYVNAVSQDIYKNIFRLHVVANSDSDEDQSLKYVVRDNIIAYFSELTNDVNSKDEIIALANNNKDEIKKVAQETINNNGYNYDVNIEIGAFAFPTKHYGDITLPAGMYDSLKIEIGETKRTKLVVCDVPTLVFY